MLYAFQNFVRHKHEFFLSRLNNLFDTDPLDVVDVSTSLLSLQTTHVKRKYAPQQ